jgi:hypothetical protein
MSTRVRPHLRNTPTVPLMFCSCPAVFFSVPPMMGRRKSLYVKLSAGTA